MFEDPRFEARHEEVHSTTETMTDAGIKVYVGGGEGGTALEKYGQPDWVTYCFTAGGTVLNALAASLCHISSHQDGSRGDGSSIRPQIDLSCPHDPLQLA